MGFVLMGTVVYLLTVVEPFNVIPTVGLLFALWLACWWIGRLSPLADVGQKLRAWAGRGGLRRGMDRHVSGRPVGFARRLLRRRPFVDHEGSVGTRR